MESGRILVMRHAEKTAYPLDPDLSDAGRQRAEKLIAFIPSTFGRPDYIFATMRSKHSFRPIETVDPLARAIGVEIDATFADQDYSALAHTVTTDGRFAGKMTLICWHHGNIPPLACALTAQSGSYPNPWEAAVFNLILRFEFVRGSASVTQVFEPF
jgi:broad specificity phosphatase PhoE